MNSKLLGLVMLLGLTIWSVAFATEPEKIPKMTAQEVLQVISRITNWIFTFLMVVVVIMVVVAGYLFVTGGGNPDQVAKARQMLIYALVGFAVAMVARGIIALVSMIIAKPVELPKDLQ